MDSKTNWLEFVKSLNAMQLEQLDRLLTTTKVMQKMLADMDRKTSEQKAEVRHG